MRRIVLATSVALLLSGCEHWIRWPRVGPAPESPSRVPRPNDSPIHHRAPSSEPSPDADGTR
jgi:hypothetical protein